MRKTTRTAATDTSDYVSLPIETILTIMKYEDHRRATFNRWPISGMSPSELAAAGLFYTGTGDTAMCAFCQNTLSDWKSSDRALVRHRQVFPGCPYVRGKECGNFPRAKTKVPRPVLDFGHTKSGVYTRYPENYLSLDDVRRRQLFKAEDHRLQSFKYWNSTAAHPSELAEAGFYYLGFGDAVKCAFCDGEVASWKRSDQPFAVHAANFPGCGFVLRRDVGNIPLRAAADGAAAGYGIDSADETVGEFPAPPPDSYPPGTSPQRDEWRAAEQETPPMLPAVMSIPRDASMQPALSTQGGRVIRSRDRVAESPEVIYSSAQMPDYTSPAACSGFALPEGAAPGSPSRSPPPSLGRLDSEEFLERMGDPQLRLESFKSWPYPEIIDPRVLAEACFYYRGVADHVSCPFCDITLSGWEKGDDALMLHVKYSPQCPFVECLQQLIELKASDDFNVMEYTKDEQDRVRASSGALQQSSPSYSASVLRHNPQTPPSKERMVSASAVHNEDAGGSASADRDRRPVLSPHRQPEGSALGGESRLNPAATSKTSSGYFGESLPPNALMYTVPDVEIHSPSTSQAASQNAGATVNDWEATRRLSAPLRDDNAYEVERPPWRRDESAEAAAPPAAEAGASLGAVSSHRDYTATRNASRAIRSGVYSHVTGSQLPSPERSSVAHSDRYYELDAARVASSSDSVDPVGRTARDPSLGQRPSRARDGAALAGAPEAIEANVQASALRALRASAAGSRGWLPGAASPANMRSDAVSGTTSPVGRISGNPAAAPYAVSPTQRPHLSMRSRDEVSPEEQPFHQPPEHRSAADIEYARGGEATSQPFQDGLGSASSSQRPFAVPSPAEHYWHPLSGSGASSIRSSQRSAYAGAAHGGASRVTTAQDAKANMSPLSSAAAHATPQGSGRSGASGLRNGAAAIDDAAAVEQAQVQGKRSRSRGTSAVSPISSDGELTDSAGPQGSRGLAAADDYVVPAHSGRGAPRSSDRAPYLSNDGVDYDRRGAPRSSDRVAAHAVNGGSDKTSRNCGAPGPEVEGVEAVMGATPREANGHSAASSRHSELKQLSYMASPCGHRFKDEEVTERPSRCPTCGWNVEEFTKISPG